MDEEDRPERRINTLVVKWLAVVKLLQVEIFFARQGNFEKPGGLSIVASATSGSSEGAVSSGTRLPRRGGGRAGPARAIR